MPLIQWNDDLQLGIESVDNQHKKLVALVNTLDEAKKSGKGSRVMGELLQNLINYTVEHFEFEESLMKASSYPDLELHCVQHKQLVDKVLHFQHQFVDGRQRITKDVMQFLRYWLESHILKEDMAFGAYAQAPENQEVMSTIT